MVRRWRDFRRGGAISGAVSLGLNIVILDEPTANLAVAETGKLLDVVM
jgi:ABC-type sugar transport system ATPase subunit